MISNRAPGSVTRRRALLQAGGFATAMPVAMLGRSRPAAAAQRVEAFGAKGNGSQDDWSAIKNALANAENVVFTAGRTYLVSRTLVVPSNRSLIGNNAVIKLAGNRSERTPVISLEANRNIEITDLIVDGNRAAQNVRTDGRITENGGMHCIRSYGAANVKLRDVTMRNAHGDGLYLGNKRSLKSRSFRVERCVMTNSRRSGSSVTLADDVAFVDCVFRGSNGQLPEAGVNIETHQDNEVLDGVTFTDCTFEDNNLRGLKVDVKENGSKIIGLKVRGCRLVGNRAGDDWQMQLSGRQGTTLQDVEISGNEFDNKFGVSRSGSGGAVVMRNVRLFNNRLMRGGVVVRDLSSNSSRVVFENNTWASSPVIDSSYKPSFIDNNVRRS